MRPAPGAAGVLRCFRGGRWYESADTTAVVGGLRVCLAPEIMLRGDARKAPAGPLRMAGAARREILRRAVSSFRDGAPVVGGIGAQDPAGFAASLGEIVGLPESLVWRWCDLLAASIAELAEVAPDRHSTLVWLPGNTFTCLVAVAEAVLRGSVVVVRPSNREPLSSARFVAALLDAGWPADRIRFCPTETAMLDPLIRLTDRQIVYGGETVGAAVSDVSTVEFRGPGRACAIVAADTDPDHTAAWLAGLVAADSGRFCTNVCTIACLGDPAALTNRLGALLDGIELAADPRWPVGWVSERTADRTADFVAGRTTAADRRLTTRELVVHSGGRTFLAPTLLRLPSPAGHPLAGCELPFPFASVVAADEPAVQRLVARSRFVYRTGVSA
ncbi:MAG TPA: aldehyde dehydrogenase family protein [Actinophytocola sp.]|uniref:aldehyde dehydrogenase family protein n=1 Tax=Actinophytocola sp. TaxID=1872138 RepID=UPI002DBD81CD|nr:aldehyde dehydrogenase family protein [Actinophytocola sp.]HEU5474340.1 aldehyde dehydrogenase family protein [Actinophytocola sp.]